MFWPKQFPLHIIKYNSACFITLVLTVAKVGGGGGNPFSGSGEVREKLPASKR